MFDKLTAEDLTRDADDYNAARELEASPMTNDNTKGKHKMRTIKIEKPNSDAIVWLSSEAELSDFVAEHNIADAVWDSEFEVYRVPAFADGRRIYSEAKQKDCDRWSCE